MTGKTVIILTLIFTLPACRQRDKGSFSLPQTLDDGWEVSAPDKAGFDRKELEKLIAETPAENPKLTSLVITRHGKLVVDQYFNGYSPDSLQKIWSVTKAITGTLLGIGADKGLLSEKDSIYKYLGEYPDKNSAAGNITIEHLITMTSGFEWVELGGPESAGFQLPYARNWIEFILNQPHTTGPGEKFNYSTGNTILLAPIIKNATGQQAKDFAQDNLFLPMGITHYEWDRQSEFWTKTQNGELPGAKRPADLEFAKDFAALTNTGSGLRMRPRDLCKVGQLYLNRGTWNGNRLVSEKWIQESTKPHFGNNNYGYHWRLGTLREQPYYYATGFGLQKMYIFPALELLIVMTQQHYETMPAGEKWTNRFLCDLVETIND